MKQFSASHTTSRNSSLPHNRREENYTGKNVDRNGIHEQWFRKEIEDLYSEIFSDSIERYNAKQKRADRMIKDSNEYLDKIRNEWDEYYKKGIWENGEFVRPFNDYDDALNHLNYNKGRNPRSAYYESIVQIGNQENQPDFETSKAILKEYLDTFQERNPNLRLLECHFHGDEATPHIHLDFVPVATGYKQGLDVQNGFDKALMQQMGLERSGTKLKTPSLQWYEQEQEALAEIALKYGIEISSEKVLEPGRKEHESVKAYKARQEATQELDDEREFLKNRRSGLNDKEKALSEREKALNDRESSYGARERALKLREDELARGVSQRLSEAQRELERVKQEKERLEQENARKRAENAKLDVIGLEKRDELEKLNSYVLTKSDAIMINYMKTHNLQDGRNMYDVYSTFAVKEYDKQNKVNKQSKQSGIVDVIKQNDEYKRNHYESLNKTDRQLDL
jgi:hypothetical protein